MASVRRNAPFFSPLAVGLIHSSAGTTSFFSFFSFSFFTAFEVVTGAFTAAFASFSRRFTSFLAVDERHVRFEMAA